MPLSLLRFNDFSFHRFLLRQKRAHRFFPGFDFKLNLFLILHEFLKHIFFFHELIGEQGTLLNYLPLFYLEIDFTKLTAGGIQFPFPGFNLLQLMLPYFLLICIGLFVLSPLTI